MPEQQNTYEIASPLTRKNEWLIYLLLLIMLSYPTLMNEAGEYEDDFEPQVYVETQEIPVAVDYVITRTVIVIKFEYADGHSHHYLINGEDLIQHLQTTPFYFENITLDNLDLSYKQDEITSEIEALYILSEDGEELATITNFNLDDWDDLGLILEVPTIEYPVIGHVYARNHTANIRDKDGQFVGQLEVSEEAEVIAFNEDQEITVNDRTYTGWYEIYFMNESGDRIIAYIWQGAVRFEISEIEESEEPTVIVHSTTPPETNLQVTEVPDAPTTPTETSTGVYPFDVLIINGREIEVLQNTDFIIPDVELTWQTPVDDITLMSNPEFAATSQIRHEGADLQARIYKAVYLGELNSGQIGLYVFNMDGGGALRANFIWPEGEGYIKAYNPDTGQFYQDLSLDDVLIGTIVMVRIPDSDLTDHPYVDGITNFNDGESTQATIANASDEMSGLVAMIDLILLDPQAH